MLKRINLNDLALMVGVLLVYAILYIFNNRLQFFEIWNIPRTAFDEIVVFSPNWIWIYLSAYLMPVAMFFFLIRLNLHLYFLQLFFILTIITNIVFFLFPSSIDRIPVPMEGVSDLTKLAFEILFSADKPFTCLPSTHVSTSFIAALSVRNHPRLFLIFTVFALLISYSALAIGQHYVYDAIAGGFAALLALVIHERTVGAMENQLALGFQSR